MKTLLSLLVLCLPLAAQPKIIYSKSFPGSSPEFVLITLESSGKAEYKESVNDDMPVRFRLKQDQADTIFALAAKLDKFQRPLESGLKVANMGMKTFRWEEGTSKPAEVKFNFSQDVDAQAILDWFEKMSESANHFIALERSVRYDKLGVNQVLLQFNAAFDRGRVLGLDQFLPLLDRVIKNDGYLNMDRERAVKLADTIRNLAPAATPSQ